MIRAAGLEGPVKMIAVQGQVLSLTEDSVKIAPWRRGTGYRDPTAAPWPKR